MNTLTQKSKYFWLFGLTVVVIALVSGIGVTASKVVTIQEHPMQHVTNALPRITSKVKKLKVVGSAIENQGQPDAMAVIDLQNNSDLPVTGVTLTFGDVSVGEDGGISSDIPLTVIEPHATFTMRFALSNLEKDVPIFVGGAIYADNTEDGQEVVLELMHHQRATEKSKRDAQKGTSHQ